MTSKTAAGPSVPGPSRQVRNVPPEWARCFGPGHEYSEYGDLYWRLHGQPDGTAPRDKINPDLTREEGAEAYMDLAKDVLNSKSPPPQVPKNGWKWPLTHAERIGELIELLEMDDWKRNHINIRACIAWHGRFPVDELCPDDMRPVCFSDGKLSHEEPMPPYWIECSGNRDALEVINFF